MKKLCIKIFVHADSAIESENTKVTGLAPRKCRPLVLLECEMRNKKCGMVVRRK